MKKTIFIKVTHKDPSNSNKEIFSMSPETLGKFLNLIREAVGDEYKVVAIPFDFAIMNSDEEIILKM
jgi:hypothetical protein